jgi:hypothetical protein
MHPRQESLRLGRRELQGLVRQGLQASCRDDGAWRELYGVRELVFGSLLDGRELHVQGEEVVRLV